MKVKYLFFTLVLFVSVASLNAQSWTDWGSWKSVSCFKGIDFRVKSKKTSYGKYEMYIEFKNRYRKDIHFTYEIKGGAYKNRNNRTTVRAGDVKKIWGGASYTSDYFNVYLDRLRFGRDGLQPYANCDK